MELTLTDRMELRFVGAEIAPETVRLGELAQVLTAFEQALLAIIQATVDGEERREEISISLTSIEAGSVGLQYATFQPRTVLPAYYQFATAIANGRPGDLPSRSREHLRTIGNFVRRRNCNAELRLLPRIAVDTPPKPLAIITPATDLPSPPLLREETTIFGTITRVGGVDPKVMLLTTWGQLISCKVEMPMAKQLAQHLYEDVTLEGDAVWRSEDLHVDLAEFTARRIVAYRDRSLSETIQSLRERFGDRYDAIENVDDFLAELRDDLTSEWEESEP